MTNAELVELFVPGSQFEKNAFIKDLSAEVVADCSIPYDSLSPLRRDQTARKVVLLSRFRQAFAHDSAQNHAANFSNEAIGVFVDFHRPFVQKIIKPLCRSYDIFAVDDLVAEGQIGLIEALPRFDLGPSEVPVLGFASNRIYGAAVDAIRSHGNLVRIGRGALRQQLSYTRLSDLGKTDDEIADLVGVNKQRLMQTVRRVSSMSRIQGLDFNDDSQTPLNDVLTDPHQTSVEEAQQLCELRDTLIETLSSTLDPREQTIAKMYYGFSPFDTPLTMNCIGELTGLTESRISQINTKIVAKLRKRLAAQEY